MQAIGTGALDAAIEAKSLQCTPRQSGLPFIVFGDAQFLTNPSTVWGKVIDGMDAVDQIKKAPAGSQSGQVDNPDKIVRMRVKADIEG